MKAEEKKLYKHVEFLTGIIPPRNYLNMESLNLVANYIDAKFREYGYPVEEQPFEVDGRLYRNIIASTGPRGEGVPRIIVGAHYDVAGDQPGADDNASAVAGLLETARLLAPLRDRLSRRIDFVAYTLEEPPYFGTSYMGSAVHAESLSNEGVNVEFMVCYEMIGYFSDKPGSQSYPEMMPEINNTNKGDFIIVVGIERYRGLAWNLASLMQKHCAIKVESINFPGPQGLIGLSDHNSYWKKGFPAVMLTDTSFLRNPHYHQETDTIDTLDFPRMTEVINGMAGALSEMGTA